MFSNPENNLIQFGINRGIIIADFGAGSGHYAISSAKKTGEHGKVFCIDIQADLLRRLQKEAEMQGVKNMQIIWSDLEKENGSTLKSDFVDAVIIANSFFQIKKKDEVINEAKRIMKKNGRILFIEWSDSFGGLGPHQDDVFSAKDAISFFNKNDLEIERQISAGDHHYGFILRKK